MLEDSELERREELERDELLGSRSVIEEILNPDLTRQGWDNCRMGEARQFQDEAARRDDWRGWDYDPQAIPPWHDRAMARNFAVISKATASNLTVTKEDARAEARFWAWPVRLIGRLDWPAPPNYVDSFVAEVLERWSKAAAPAGQAESRVASSESTIESIRLALDSGRRRDAAQIRREAQGLGVAELYRAALTGPGRIRSESTMKTNYYRWLDQAPKCPRWVDGEMRQYLLSPLP